MLVFRVHNRKYDPLDGTGAAMVGGRWNPAGVQLVYAAMSFEGALLEQLVRANTGRLPGNRMAARIEIPDGVEVAQFEEAQTPEWRDEAVSRRVGEDWIERGETVALVVPSAVARPWGRNILLNPRHSDFGRVSVLEATEVVWDPRLAFGNQGQDDTTSS